MPVRDVIIVGAGPSGLSAGIASKKHGLDYEILEQGLLVNSIYRFPPAMVFFTTPELLEIGGIPFVSPYEKPTRNEALKYYRKIVDTFDLQVSLGETVVAVTRRADGVFEVESRPSTGGGVSSGRGTSVRQARNVVFAIGYYDHPVMLGIPGEDLPHVSHYYREPHPFYRQRVVVIGGGNSAAEAALEMHRSGAHVTIVHRAPTLKNTIKYWVRPDIENRIKEGSIAARFNATITAIRPASVLLKTAECGDVLEEIPADAVLLLTGYRADSDLMTRAGVRLNERDAPVVNPETFETNVPGLFVAGGAIAGVDTGTIFIENGRFHGDKIIEAIATRV